VLKFRGGMPLLGRDAGVRPVPHGQLDGAARRAAPRRRPDQALGGRGFDNYSWHTDLPPGHPMVTGQQTVEFDLCNAVEHARRSSSGA
jgi:nitrate reductase / nitrite oxidoreductase, alpha subunit